MNSLVNDGKYYFDFLTDARNIRLTTAFLQAINFTLQRTEAGIPPCREKVSVAQTASHFLSCSKK